jgi:oligosaccharide repeat unit polymerase
MTTVEAAWEAPPARPRRLIPGPTVGVWWLTPIGAPLLVVPISLFGAWVIGDARYRQEWRTPKVIDGSFTVMLGIGLVALLLGAAVPVLARRRTWYGPWPALSIGDRALLYRASTWIFRATIGGYAALLAAGMSRGVTPVTLLHILLSFDFSSDILKRSFAPIAGLTTFTQLGIAYVIVAGLLLGTDDEHRTRRRLAVVMVAAAARAFLLSERLALLELVIPLIAVWALRASGHTGRRRRIATLAPVALIPVVVAVFGAFEYVRSWQVYKTQDGTSFLDFVMVRFAGYYATAYNNAAIAYQHSTFPHRMPYGSIQAVWDAPVISQVGLYGLLTGGGNADAAYGTALAQYGNPEFNNPGGLGVPFTDFGPVGGVIYFFVLGAVVGLIWASLRAGSAWGMLIYPVVVTTLLEIPRYLYLVQGRVLPALAALLLIAWRLQRGRPSTRLAQSP